jgi:hypothetical protein
MTGNSMFEMLPKFNEIFGFVKIKFGETEYPIKFSMGSLIELEKQGISGNVSSISIEDVAKLIWCGLPREIREQITYEQMADTIEMEQLSNLLSRVTEKINYDTMQIKADESQPSSEKPKKKLAQKK